MQFDLVIFDMDGTLTVDVLDFDTLRAQLGLTRRQPVLEWIATLPEPTRSEKWRVLHHHESQAAQSVPLRPGVGDMLQNLKVQGVTTALLSRNSRQSVETVMSRHQLSFDVVVSRDEPPIKPDPQSIMRIMRHCSVAAARTLMVGDYIFDVEAARGAGVASALLVEPQAHLPPFAAHASYIIRNMGDVPTLLRDPERFVCRTGLSGEAMCSAVKG
ncbi:MAG: HAD family hydrolase [Phycisphaerales bacterium]|nr:HAD family hydrolase [Phycisphaerales bacterium]